MAVRMVPCRNTVTGGQAELPETALPHLPNWQPIGSAPQPVEDGDRPTGNRAQAPSGSPTEPSDTTKPRRSRMAAPAAEPEGV